MYVKLRKKTLAAMLCSTKWEEIVACWLFTTHGSLSQLLFEPSPNFCDLLLSIEEQWIMKISPGKHWPYMRYVCGAQKEDISGYAMLHKVRRDRCSLVIYHTRISLSQLLFEPSPNFCELLLSIEGRWIMKRDLSCSDASASVDLQKIHTDTHIH